MGLVLDRVDKILLITFEKLLADQPDIADGVIAVINERTGALAAELLNRGLQARTINDSAAVSRRIQDATHPNPIHYSPDESSLRGVSTVLYRLPRPTEALEETSWHVARWALPEVVMISGASQKHMRHSMNTVLEQNFLDVSATRGAFKARALVAREPKPLNAQRTSPPRIPRKNTVTLRQQDLHLRAYGLTFGSARLDQGTELLLETALENFEAFSAAEVVVDLGCGNGSVMTALAKHTNVPKLIASDDSFSAVRSTRETLEANGYDPEDLRFSVLHQDGLVNQPDKSVDVVLLNPPFHDGNELTRSIAHHLFRESARVLAPGGNLWCVFNAGLNYRPVLSQEVGPTHQVNRNKTFIVTQSIKK